MDVTCTVFKQDPIDIWVEGRGGIRIERNIIFRRWQNRGPSPPNSDAAALMSCAASPQWRTKNMLRQVVDEVGTATT